MAKSSRPIKTNSKISDVLIRMYRPGTGDCFLLQFRNSAKKSVFNMMIDFGCINGRREDFVAILNHIKASIPKKGGKTPIDLLAVTHQHADHINGFKICAKEFESFDIKKVWFAWTEDDKDTLANNYRKKFSDLGFALNKTVSQLNKLKDDGYYKKMFSGEEKMTEMAEGREVFIRSLTNLNDLSMASNVTKGKPLPTMEEMLRKYNVIKGSTEVEFMEPGDTMSNIPSLKGMRFFVLGPPRDRKYLNRVHAKGQNYEKREEKSDIDFTFLSAMGVFTDEPGETPLPFDPEYELADGGEMKAIYDGEEYRKIDNDWLFSAGSLAMRYENSINNTSLVLAIQFEESQRVLLFPGDAELGNWESWHDGLEWPVKIDGKLVKKKADYLLNHTVFYKVGHHLSQNGTAKGKGVEMMISPDLSAMATVNFSKIYDTWLRTMPNDLLGAELIKKTKGKIYFSGDSDKILENIRTDRVVIKKEHEDTLRKANGKFKGKPFIECIINSV